MDRSSSTTSTIFIRSIDDLRTIQKEPLKKELKVELNEESASAAFVNAFQSIKYYLNSITHITLDADFNWSFTYARDFIETLASLPGLKHFYWIAGNDGFKNKIPISALTIVLECCQGLECLKLEGLHFLTSAVFDMPITRERDSATLTFFTETLWNLSSLREYECLYCRISEITTLHAPPLVEEERPGRKSLTEWWVDMTLKALAYIQSLECLYIIASPYPSTPGRILLGLCKDGELANQAIQKVLVTLMEPQTKQYQKLRLWMSQTYETKDDSQLLLKFCHAFRYNSDIVDFRVRGVGEASARFVTPSVIEAYRDLLGTSSGNFTLTSCDLLLKQGKLIDFYCRMNSIGRGDVWRQLPAMTRQNWVESILIKYQNDLDVLYYWNRVHPVFFSTIDQHWT